jgi:hypothetical protein
MFNDRSWVKKLVPGNIVAYNTSRFGEPRYKVVKVEKVTPTGRITTNDGLKWNNEGMYKVSDWEIYWLSEYTPELNKQIDEKKRKNAALSKITATKFNELPVEKLEEIVKLL